MDKETLSNYGWIVICVLVLAVMLALATPFGTFVADAIKSTTQGLFDVNQNALNSTGLINIGGQSFGENGNGGAGDSGETPVVPGEPETPVDPEEPNTPEVEFVTVRIYGDVSNSYVDATCPEGMTWAEFVASEYNTYGFKMSGNKVLLAGSVNGPFDYDGYTTVTGDKLVNYKTTYYCGFYTSEVRYETQTFSIQGLNGTVIATFVFEEGMTWEEYLSSPYNAPDENGACFKTYEYGNSNNTIGYFNGSGWSNVHDNNQSRFPEVATETIIANHSYIIAADGDLVSGDHQGGSN